MAAVSAFLVLVLGAGALGDNALALDEVEHSLEQLQAAVPRLGGGGLRNVKHPRGRTHQ